MSATKQQLQKLFYNKNILVTGGTGSIGQEIVAALQPFSPKQIIVFSKDDTKQYLMKNRLIDVPNVHFILGDIREYRSIEAATKGVDIIFHTAALKQVPVCEENPFEAVKTNIIGSENVIRSAINNNVKTVVNISTDKAVNPYNTLGASKLIAEKLFHQANAQITQHGTRFCSVRFGNIIGSRGSVIPIFMEQARRGEDLTVTGKEMTRFFITIPEAVERIFKAMYYCSGGETFILKMNAFRIQDLAQAVSKLFQKRGKAVGIRFTSARSGEKLYEELVFDSEREHVLEDDELYVILPGKKGNPYHHFKSAQVHSYRSDLVPHLKEQEILQILSTLYEANL